MKATNQKEEIQSQWAKSMVKIGVLISLLTFIPIASGENRLAVMVFLLGVLFFGIDEDYYFDAKKKQVIRVVTFFSMRTFLKKVVATAADFHLIRVIQFNETTKLQGRVSASAWKTLDYRILLIGKTNYVTVFMNKSYDIVRANAVDYSKQLNLKFEDKVREKMIKNLEEREARMKPRL